MINLNKVSRRIFVSLGLILIRKENQELTISSKLVLIKSIANQKIVVNSNDSELVFLILYYKLFISLTSSGNSS